MRRLILIAVALISSAAFADEAQLVRVTTDAVPGFLDVKLVLNQDHEITAIKYVGTSTTESFDVSELPVGIVMLRHSGKEVVKLIASGFDVKEGGKLNINYLSSGISNARGDYWVTIQRQGQNWQIVRDDSAGRRVFTKMFMKARKVLGNTVGIQSITVFN